MTSIWEDMRPVGIFMVQGWLFIYLEKFSSSHFSVKLILLRCIGWKLMFIYQYNLSVLNKIKYVKSLNFGFHPMEADRKIDQKIFLSEEITPFSIFRFKLLRFLRRRAFQITSFSDWGHFSIRRKQISRDSADLWFYLGLVLLLDWLIQLSRN